MHQLVRREQLRFLRDTARNLRVIAFEPTCSRSDELRRLAKDVEREADDLEVISLREVPRELSH
jgi:hypothetical protein